MALKTSLPSPKRIFWIFAVLAFISATALAMVNPQASEVTDVTTLSSATQGGCLADIVVLLQLDGTVNDKISNADDAPTRLDEMKDATNSFATSVASRNTSAGNNKTRVGLVTFLRNPVLGVSLTEDTDKFQTTVNKLAYQKDGGIALGDAIERGQAGLVGSGARTTAKKIMIILGDGRDPADSNPVAKAKRAKDAGTTIFAIAIGEKGALPDVVSKDGLEFDASGKQIGTLMNKITSGVCPTSSVQASCKMDMAIAVDVSGSMYDVIDKPIFGESTTKIREAKKAIKTLSSKIEAKEANYDNAIKSQIGLVTFGKKAEVHLTLTPSQEIVREYVDKIRRRDDTSMGDAITESRKLLMTASNARSDAKKVLLIISDGKETEQPESKVVNQAVAAKNDGIEIFTIGISEGGLLKKLASNDPPKHFYLDPTASKLRTIIDAITIDTCPVNLSVRTQISRPILRKTNIATVTYTITNNSTTSAHDVVLKQTLPTDLITSDNKNAFEAKFSLMPKQSTKTATFKLKVKEGSL